MKTIAVLLLTAWTLKPAALVHEEPETGKQDLFASDSLLEVELRFNLDSLRTDIGDNPSYHEGSLSYLDPVTRNRHTLKISVRTRGNFRKDPGNCDFPPLKLKIGKPERPGTIFEGNGELKLVTHCQSGKEEFEHYLVEEYLIYKAYNLFTDYSFRVRLARITYTDTGPVGTSFTHYGFFLENDEGMAERNHAGIMKLESISREQLDQDYFALLAMFNYMMLNTDYSIPIVHNVVILYSDRYGSPIPVPFDFDWSGMINIPYDSPYAARETRYAGRKYKGPCLRPRKLDEIFGIMRSKRDELYRLYRDCPYLNEDQVRRSIQELNMFYIIIGNKKLVRQEFLRKCQD